MTLMKLLNALHLCTCCSRCLFQGLVCSNRQLSSKGHLPVSAQFFVLFSCECALTLLEVTHCSCFTQGRSPGSSNIWVGDGGSIYAVEGADIILWVGVGSNLLINPCGELLGLERRQLVSISEIPCASSCSSFKLCFLWHPVPSRGQCWKASSTHGSIAEQLQMKAQ